MARKKRKPDAPPAQVPVSLAQVAAYCGMALAAGPDEIPADYGFAREKLLTLQAVFPDARVVYATRTIDGRTEEFIPTMISEEQAENAVYYLRDSARRAAQAKAEYGYLEAFTKVVKAKLMRECAETTNGEREAFAMSHPTYQEHLKAVRLAEEKTEYEKFSREASNCCFEAWRTQQANERAGRP